MHGDYHPDTQTYHIYYEEEQPPPISTRVIRGVSTLTGERPTDIEPLHDVIAPDALNRLFESVSEDSSDHRTSVSFPLEGCEVTVYADGEVVISIPSTRRGGPSPRRATQILFEFGKRLLARGRKLIRNLTGP
jgi:hypothetical protein